MERVIVACVLLSGAVVSSRPLGQVETPYRDCGSTGIVINRINVNNCTDMICNVTRGTYITSIITFTPKIEYKTLNNFAEGELDGISVPFQFIKPSVCDHGVACPMKDNQPVTETLTALLPKEYPAVPDIASKLELLDSNNKMQGCLEVQFKLL